MTAFLERRRPTIRLTPEQDQRLDRVAAEAGQTKQAFALAAIVHGIEEAEAKNAARKTQRAAKKAAATTAPTGLGITFEAPRPARLEVELGQVEPKSESKPELKSTEPKPVVGTLTAYVAGGATDGERRRRLGQASDVLRAAPETAARAAELAEEVRVAAGLDTSLDRFKLLLRGGT